MLDHDPSGLQGQFRRPPSGVIFGTFFAVTETWLVAGRPSILSYVRIAICARPETYCCQADDSAAWVLQRRATWVAATTSGTTASDSLQRKDCSLDQIAFSSRQVGVIVTLEAGTVNSNALHPHTPAIVYKRSGRNLVFFSSFLRLSGMIPQPRKQ